LRSIAYDRRTLAVLVVLGAAVAARELMWSTMLHTDQRLIDLRVFWCGGQAALGGANPYLFEPLRTCEHGFGAGLFAKSPNFVMPFVLPPFDVAPFAALARLPYGTAALLFTLIGALALAAGIVLVAASARVPVTLAAAALLVSVGLPSLTLGQLVPLELLVTAAAAFALVRRWDAAAGVCAALSLLEPHVGAFVVVGVAAAVPRARWALAGTLAVLAGASVRAGSVAPFGVYAAALAAHARAEAGSAEQYSLTHALRYLHAPVDVAVVLGAVSTVLLLVVAAVLARAFAARDVRAGIVYLPAACAVVGGSFVHLTQIALAVPAALLLFAHARDAVARRLAALAVIALAIPWPYPTGNKQTLAATLVVLAVTVWYAGGGYRVVAAAVAALWIVLVPLENRPPPAPPVPVLARPAPTELASESWHRALVQTESSAPRSLLIEIPTWLGLLALLGSTAIVLRTGRRAGAEPARAAWPNDERITQPAPALVPIGVSNAVPVRQRDK
jgi:hypothetical protein